MKANPAIAKRLVACVSLPLLAACGPLPIHTSFDTLTNETSNRSSEYLTFTTFISLSGIVPQHGTQLLFHQPDFSDWKPSSPSLAIGFSPTRSFVTERKFEMSGNPAADAQAIRDVRDELEQAKLLSLGLAAARTRRNAAQTLVTAIGNGKANDDQAQQLKTLLGESVIGGDGKPADSEVKKALGDIDNEVKEKLEPEVSKALAAAKTKAARNNVVITRWAQEKRSRLGAFFSEVFALSGQGHETRSGTLVFGDFRVVSLHAGDDLIDMLRGTRRVKYLFDNVGITTFSVKARHMAYIADMDIEKAVALRLNLTKEQLADLSATFSSLNADLSASYAVTTDISNSASINDSRVHTYRRCFFPPQRFEKAIRDEIKASEGYQDLYAVRVQIKNPVLELATRTRTAFSEIAEKCIKGDVIDVNLEECREKDLEAWEASCDEPPNNLQLSGVKGDITPGSQPKAESKRSTFQNQPYRQ